jgi:hypothetical protein
LQALFHRGNGATVPPLIFRATASSKLTPGSAFKYASSFTVSNTSLRPSLAHGKTRLSAAFRTAAGVMPK